MGIQIHVLRALQDNYVYMLHRDGSNSCVVIDPSEAEPVVKFLEEKNLTLGLILNTHHHRDHIGGNDALVRRYHTPIYCSETDLLRIPGAERGLKDNDIFEFDGISFRVLEIPGHTQGQIAFLVDSEHAAFVGDTLFSLGCGRLFEGTAEQLWKSITRLMSLPGETRLYFGHEYTERNAAFARTIEPSNSAIAERLGLCQSSLELTGSCSAPFLDDEKKVNPFLRVDQSTIRSHLGMMGLPSVEVFAQLRKMRDTF